MVSSVISNKQSDNIRHLDVLQRSRESRNLLDIDRIDMYN